MSSRMKHGYRNITASRVLWHIAPGQGMEPPKGVVRRSHFFAQKRAEGINYGITYEPNGVKERIRRIVQIRDGRLKAENGLVSS